MNKLWDKVERWLSNLPPEFHMFTLLEWAVFLVACFTMGMFLQGVFAPYFNRVLAMM